MNKPTRKIMLIIFAIVIIVLLLWLIKREIKLSQTVSDMSLDTTNTVITGIWDDEDLSKYKYLVIPDIVVGSGNMLEYSNVTDIGEGAFEDNVWIESVHIPTHIVRIQKDAFNGCTSLRKITYAGTKEQWEQIIIESGNDCLSKIVVEFNAQAPPTKDR